MSWIAKGTLLGAIAGLVAAFSGKMGSILQDMGWNAPAGGGGVGVTGYGVGFVNSFGMSFSSPSTTEFTVNAVNILLTIAVFAAAGALVGLVISLFSKH